MPRPRRNAGRRGDRPLYMIGVAAELAGVHPQTLRIYERRALLCPRRSAGNTRLYSDADIERLRLIHQLTQQDGVNLAGVVRIMDLMDERERMSAEIAELRSAMENVHRTIEREVAAAHASSRREIVLVPRGVIQRREGRGE